MIVVDLFAGLGGFSTGARMATARAPAGIRRDAVHMLGNAVCPPVARDLLLAIGAAA